MTNNTSVDWYDQNPTHYHDHSKDNVFIDLHTNFTTLVEPNGKILDSGCGNGRDAKIFSEMGFAVTGVDLSASLITIAKEFAPKAQFQLADICNLPFEKESFDGIWSMASLLHVDSLEDMAAAIASDYNVLKTGGILHIITAFKYDDTRKFTTDETPQRTFLRVTAEEINEMCITAGFETITCTVLAEDKMKINGRPTVQWVYYLGRKK